MTDPAADLLPEGLADRLPVAAAALTRARRAALDAIDALAPVGHAHLQIPSQYDGKMRNPA